MTGYYVRIGSENKEITTLTPEDWNELIRNAARSGDGSAGWRLAIALAGWIKKNVIAIENKSGPKPPPGMLKTEGKDSSI